MGWRYPEPAPAETWRGSASPHRATPTPAQFKSSWGWQEAIVQLEDSSGPPIFFQENGFYNLPMVSGAEGNNAGLP